MKKIFLMAAAGAGTLFLTACGYTTKSALPPSLRYIHVEPFKNKIDFNSINKRNLYIPLLEVDVRNAIIDRYLFDGNLRVSEEEGADLVLRGELVNFDRGELRSTDDNEVQEYRIYISVNLELWDPRRQEVRWTENNFTGEATYFVSGPKATSEQSAISEAMTDLARRIVERTIEDW